MSIAETLSTFTISPSKARGCGDLERVRAFITSYIIVLLIFDFIKSVGLNAKNEGL